MASAVEACVHCGFCLPTCPTYQLLGDEGQSPRGRILIMKGVLEGELTLDEATPFLDPCLGCLACVTSCPSGVQYGDLITPFRLQSEKERKRSPWDRLLRRLVLDTLPHPDRFRTAARLGRVAKPLRRLLPGKLGTMLDLLPGKVPPAREHPPLVAAVGERRARVALLLTCAQQVLAPDIDAAALRVLAHNGVEVVVPEGQVCCGALGAHTGSESQAQAFARATLERFPDDVDAVITTAAGCGSGVHEYPLWLAGEPEEAAARVFAAKARDITTFLAELGPRETPPLPRPLKVAYHDACHLAHAQGVTLPPRSLLGAIPNLELCELRDPEICCGSAGTYSLEQPELAAQLGRRKAEAVLATGADAVASGNIGCLTQLRSHLERLGRPLPIYHTIELLDRAYGGQGG
jgi:glycolate oxidase iron-sulfur subunit